MLKIKLYCLPYAGGSAAIYDRWRNFLDSQIELEPIELAGRGRRFNDSLYGSLDDAVDDIFNLIKNEIHHQPYALFGHSFGASLSYLLVRKIKLLKLPEPKHIFFSGKGAPHLKDIEHKKFYLMDDEEFAKELIALGGTPPEFFQHKELTDFMLPILRNDFKLADVSLCNGEITPFNFDITVFLGKEEFINAEQIDGWKQYTSKMCTVHHFNGGHFFLHKEINQITNIINQVLKGNYSAVTN